MLALSICVTSLVLTNDPDVSFDRSVLAMGTTLQVHLVGDAHQIQQASEDAIREIERIEALCSTWQDSSEWSRFNRARGRPTPLSSESITLLQKALWWQHQTGGAFDPVLGRLIEVWGIRTQWQVPSDQQLQSARLDSGGSLLVIDASERQAKLNRPNAAVEEGGFVKGYALDRALIKLRASGIPSGWLNFGGQVTAWGSPVKSEIALPGRSRRPGFSVVLVDSSLSSSGASEHGRHILNPHTGIPSPDWGSVSVVMPDGFSADVLSTALFVMGPREGLAWADKHQVAALLQPNHSEALESQAFQLLNPVQLSNKEAHAASK